MQSIISRGDNNDNNDNNNNKPEHDSDFRVSLIGSGKFPADEKVQIDSTTDNGVKDLQESDKAVAAEGDHEEDEEKKVVDDEGEKDLTAPLFVDHFSLGKPSSTVRFRNSNIRIYGDYHDQFMLEDRVASSSNHDNNNKPRRHVVTVRRTRSSSFGLKLIRGAYTIAALLVFGFLFVFCFQLIAFLFLNLFQQGGNAEDEPTENRSVEEIIGVVLSIPIVLYGMASIMAIGGTFVVDTWTGQALFSSLLNLSVVLTEWIRFLIFLGIPVFTVCVTLFLGLDDWWEISAKVAILCIFVFMVVFALAVVVTEVSSCFELVRLYHADDGEKSNAVWWKQWWGLAGRAILTTQTLLYSGLRKESYLVDGNEEPPYYSSDLKASSISMSLYARLTQLSCCMAFDKLDPPVQSYTVDEVRDLLPIVTRRNWTLEGMCCRRRNARTLFVHNGPSALRPNQVWSSTACVLVGSMLILLLVTGVLVWYSLSVLVIALVPVIVVLCCMLPAWQSSLRLHRAFQSKHQIKEDEFDEEADQGASGVGIEAGGDKNEDTAALFEVWETLRITQPRSWFSWTTFVLELGVFYLWPLISLYVNGNLRIATVFLFLGFFSCLRLFFDAGAILMEVGSLDEIKTNQSQPDCARKVNEESGGDASTNRSGWLKRTLLERDEAEDERTMRKKARISEVVGRISRGRNVTRWMWFFLVLVVLVAVVCISAYTSEDQGGVGDYKVKGVTLAPDFYYPPQPQLPYPTCGLTKGFTLPGQELVSLLDYGFLSTLAFTGPNETKPLLDTWFGEGKVRDEYDFVARYRNDTKTNYGASYKLFSFPDSPGSGLVSIRGSETQLDWIVDVQLWLAAATAQIVRAVMPFGWIWTPVMDELVYIANAVQNTNLKKVSYYRQTTQFVNDMMTGAYPEGNYTELRVTGASLGGGLAIITGAQTGASTVAISGLNSKLSRRTYDPPVTEEQLDTRTFNVIPDRDPISHVDDPGMLYQRLQCRAPKNSFFGCHSMFRSLCEIAYQCGSNGRPIICWCVSKYGYPRPIMNGTVSWEEACPSEEDK